MLTNAILVFKLFSALVRCGFRTDEPRRSAWRRTPVDIAGLSFTKVSNAAEAERKWRRKARQTTPGSATVNSASEVCVCVENLSWYITAWQSDSWKAAVSQSVSLTRLQGAKGHVSTCSSDLTHHSSISLLTTCSLVHRGPGDGGAAVSFQILHPCVLTHPPLPQSHHPSPRRSFLEKKRAP